MSQRLGAALLAVLMTVSAVTVQGCGTIFFRFVPQKVAITSAPDGAEIMINGRPPEEQTPVTIRFSPRRDHDVKLRYVDEATGQVYLANLPLERSVRVMPLVLNLIFNLGLGLILDGLTGALFHFPNRKPHVILVPEGEEIPADGSKITPAFAAPPAATGTAGPTPAKPAPAKPAPVTPAPEPEPEPAGPVVPADAAPCEICGEPRGDITPCPSCKLE